MREISGTSKRWLIKCKRWIVEYLDYVNWEIDQDKTLEYFTMMKNSHSITFYRKKTYQIRNFLQHLKISWADEIKLPVEPFKTPKRISTENIVSTLSYFKDSLYYKQVKALILLGASTGARAHELYQLNPCDIDIENKTLRINHNPGNQQSTKTGESRITFFTEETKQALVEYLAFFNNGSNLKILFSQTHMERLFSSAPIRVKELRHFFSQTWDRCGGQTSIKKILMGHSMRHDVDLMHYNCQSEEDLKKIYAKVMTNVEMKSVESAGEGI